jgi:alkanesulfonate monooxygenase SsuD/methylene tetrahydromethanopterin reductase-like flavin-dependent oxidoreductase (luciferase family)
MEFFFFHLMPWPLLPDDFQDRFISSFVVVPRGYYDPVYGHDPYNRYLDELELADQLGFDAVCVNEHHQNAYGLMPSPNIMAAALTRRTQRAKIAILGNALPLRDHPLRVAEEVAMMDVISGGRIISGFVRGLGVEHFTFNLPPNHSRERFFEAHDLIIKAWTEPEPFAWDGKHYKLKYVNVWPRPLQQPHPPIYAPSTGSPETLQWAAERRYPFIRVFTPVAAIKAFFDDYRRYANEAGYEPSPGQFGWSVPIYVAETDAQAIEEARPHLAYFFQKLLKMPPQFLAPPGYTSEESLRRLMQAVYARPQRPATVEEMNEIGTAIVGSAETVRQRLAEYQKTLGLGLLVGLHQFGTLPHDLTVKSTTMFAQEVMPHFRQPAAAGATPAARTPD